MNVNTVVTASILILVSCGAFVVYHMVKKTNNPPKSFMILLGFISLALFTQWGNFQYIFPVKANNPKQREVKHVLFQWHEIWHYYTGSKYFKELGYYGLYDCYVLADYETRDSNIIGATNYNIRGLKDSYSYYPMQQAYDNAIAKYRPKFTRKRWEEFKQDFVLLRNTAANGWINFGLFDAGFNPPPTWNVIGWSITNTLPLSKKLWRGEKPYRQALVFPWFDVLLLVLIGYLLYRSYGIFGLATFFIIYGTSYISEMRWNAGSFLRYMWLFGLAGGLCMLKDKKYLAAGIFLGFSTCCRIFPFMFLIGAGISLLIAGIREKQWKPLKQLIIGSASIGMAMFLLGLLFFGWHSYQEFLEMILKHKDIGFIQSIGYRRVAIFGDWQRHTPTFMWEQGLINFKNWNMQMVEAWDQIKGAHHIIWAVMIAVVLISMLKLNASEATLLFGGLVLFFTQILTCYYYIFLALVPAVIINKNKDVGISNIVIFVGFILLWMFTTYVRKLTPNGIVENYYICMAILLFFIAWIIVRAYPVLHGFYVERQSKKASERR